MSARTGQVGRRQVNQVGSAVKGCLGLLHALLALELIVHMSCAGPQKSGLTKFWGMGQGFLEKSQPTALYSVPAEATYQGYMLQ